MGATIPLLLFVCVENSGRSQIAEGFARAIGQGRVQAFSAGSRPSGTVHPKAIRLMAERGIDLCPQRSKGLDDLPPGIQWDYLVTMGCGDACPHLPAHHRLDWNLPDPKDMDDAAFRQLCDVIETLVQGLVDEAAPVPSQRSD